MADGITSANVVGYQNLELDTTGRTFIGGTFLPISGTMTLGSIGVNDEFQEMGDMLYTFNNMGGAAAVYCYVKADTAAEFGLTAGWYLNDDISDWDGECELACKNDVVLEVGQMLCCSSQTDGASIVPAGQVASEDIELELDTTGRFFLANCTPADITLGDIHVSDEFQEMGDMLYTVNNMGGAAAVYCYVKTDTAAEFGLTAGWYLNADISDWDGESELACQNGVEIKAGQGVVCSSQTEGAAIIIPSAL